MKIITTIYISPIGGSITCLNVKNKRVFKSCTAGFCRYSKDLRSAKKELESLETSLLLGPETFFKVPAQRKTTLKWTSDGELSAVDMARILERLTNPALSQCDFACDIDDLLSDKTILKKSPIRPLAG